jgi:Tfp pilus assembly protein PilO
MALVSQSRRVSLLSVVVFAIFFFLLIVVVDRIMSEQRRLKEEEKNAEALLMEYQQKASEALARLSRVRKQKDFLVEKGAEMVARGLSNMDELDRVERQESEAVLDVQASGAASDVVDWGAVFGNLPDLGSLVDPGSFGGTVVTSQGSGGA